MNRFELYKGVVQHCCNTGEPWATGLDGHIDDAVLIGAFLLGFISCGDMIFPKIQRSIHVSEDASAYTFTDFYDAVDGGTSLYTVQDAGNDVRVTKYLTSIPMQEMGRKIQFNPALGDKIVIVTWRNTGDAYSVTIVNVTSMYSERFRLTKKGE